LSLASCGGSASETPWPVEPDNVDLGPIGESRAEEEPTAKPKADSKDRAEPSMDDAASDPVKKAEPTSP